MSVDWVIVTAPTDRGAIPTDELAPALRTLAARTPGVEFRTAVLGGDGRSVTEALDDAVVGGAREVLVVSGQTLADRSMDAWFRRVIGHWLRTRADEDLPAVRIGASLCEVDAYADVLAAAVDAGGAAASTTTAPLVSPLWEQIPGFARHVLVCRGPRCSAQGSGESVSALKAELDAHGLGDDDVLVTVTGCLFPCAQAPVMAVYPDNVWYHGATADRVGRIVDEHLRGGAPVTAWLGERADSGAHVSESGCAAQM
ncbi:(2Fe-2S) ferredoxin domain-containing protein [Gordonia hydrophobica]|uniref:(2Fe-2S) ferredoxin domain-containing protein n=1 Tax=Gordonia hydrophobica TaxID=40516 RepID=A0ABZ2U2P0_9ACTN|nr:(2Fe-2S) ferredoxin domain-containing protein [Gordonia hydrophobica]MBM7367759.1 (2Fe-2S) ferredoxin [Gordonia hydrophobica]